MGFRKLIRASTQQASEPTLVIEVDELAAAAGLSESTAARLAPVVTALVEQYAPWAPADVKQEAAIRCAGWLAEAPAGGQRSEEQGDIRTAFTPAATGALRHSGAMGLLSPWKVRRAGAI